MMVTKGSTPSPSSIPNTVHTNYHGLTKWGGFLCAGGANGLLSSVIGSGLKEQNNATDGDMNAV